MLLSFWDETYYRTAGTRGAAATFVKLSKKKKKKKGEAGAFYSARDVDLTEAEVCLLKCLTSPGESL